MQSLQKYMLESRLRLRARGCRRCMSKTLRIGDWDLTARIHYLPEQKREASQRGASRGQAAAAAQSAAAQNQEHFLRPHSCLPSSAQRAGRCPWAWAACWQSAQWRGCMACPCQSLGMAALHGRSGAQATCGTKLCHPAAEEHCTPGWCLPPAESAIKNSMITYHVIYGAHQQLLSA